MKTAVSIPDPTFEDAERLAARLEWSRSRLYATALREFVAAHSDDDRVTAALDRVAEALAADSPAADTEPVNTGRALIDSGAWEW